MAAKIDDDVASLRADLRDTKTRLAKVERDQKKYAVLLRSGTRERDALRRAAKAEGDARDAWKEAHSWQSARIDLLTEKLLLDDGHEPPESVEAVK